MLHQVSPIAILAATAAILPTIVSADGPLASNKRGLCFTPNDTTRADDSIWPPALSWYYNYKPLPEPKYKDIPQSEFEFVPMLWGAPEKKGDTSFVTTIKDLIKSGVNITNILSFNEPDAPYSWGGSHLDPVTAAQVWVDNIKPLSDMGLRVGLPACTGGRDGLPWLETFVRECSALVSTGSRKENCTFDFVTIHWYGNFDGLASHMGQYAAAFPNKTMWITEYNFADQSLEDTQAFYKISAEYFDRLDFVERYSLFGAFRSDVSNVGPNAAMLSNDGRLTDIGAWYLGREATGVKPTDGQSVSAAGRQNMPRTMAYLFGAVAIAWALS
ncbi:glycosyl hydrolase catalytic core-domain-containing protein [Triangularia verruculosa]|uniref:Glycosyl hydrolase catalytic core-domain-containing protein n=1 Tax=Triangularia verruculosa TaxID=2587418 RepID=A0AAN7AWJ5_9PEZI|nr:glycosyl hydrolase catalytic core-domain-containing protein [Triangularia verruculosa]